MVIVFTHKNCSDGTACAVIAESYFEGKLEVRYCSYGHLPCLDNIENQEIYITDFCFDVDILNTICDKAKKVVIIDHHQSHQENLKTYSRDNLTIIFDMTKSGCQLTWEYFYKTPIPWYFDYIGDRDLWKFSLEKSREINCALFQSGLTTFNSLKQLHLSNDEFKRRFFDTCSILGPYMYESNMKTVEYVAKSAVKAKLYTVEGKYVCSVLVWDNVNKPIMNEVGNLLARDTSVDCALLPRLDTQTLTIYASLRGREGVDTTKFSSQFFDKHGEPGGGHPGASGFEIPIEKYKSCIRFY